MTVRELISLLKADFVKIRINSKYVGKLWEGVNQDIPATMSEYQIYSININSDDYDLIICVK